MDFSQAAAADFQRLSEGGNSLEARGRSGLVSDNVFTMRAFSLLAQTVIKLYRKSIAPSLPGLG